jgi:lysyl-tRNA synthetase class 2
MAMDDPFREPDTLFAIGEGPDGIGGFLHLVPSARGRGYSLSSMPRRPATPNGLMEFVIAETIAWARGRGVEELSLNFCVFSDLVGAGANAPHRLVRRVLRAADGLFQLERLLIFSRKFQPEWRPRYLCVERLTDLGLVAVAYLKVESLLTPPGPWARRAPSRAAR